MTTYFSETYESFQPDTDPVFHYCLCVHFFALFHSIFSSLLKRAIFFNETKHQGRDEQQFTTSSTNKHGHQLYGEAPGNLSKQVNEWTAWIKGQKRCSSPVGLSELQNTRVGCKMTRGCVKNHKRLREIQHEWH